MRVRLLFKAVAAVLATVMMIQLCGCNSIIVQTAVVIEDNEDIDNEDDWSFSSYSTEVVNEYPSGGVNAFYLNSAKCLTDQIEEFHVLGFNGQTSMYYYTAPTNPSYQSENKNTGYYCLATYEVYTGMYTELLCGFYDKNNSVSMAYDVSAMGYICACIGNTYLFYYDMKLLYSFELNNDMQKAIRDSVSQQYICIDLAFINPEFNRVAAVYMDASKIDEGDSEPRCAIFDIQFDSGLQPTHTIDLLEEKLDSSHGNVCSSHVNSVEFYDMYYHVESSGKEYLELELYYPYFLLAGNTKLRLRSKSRNEELLTFSVTTDYNNQQVMLLSLYEDRLDVWVREDTYVDGGTRMAYSHVSRFELDNSRTYISMDDMPSVILVNAPDKIYTCSLTEGFRQIGAPKSKIQTYTIKRGSYYAAYMPFLNYYYLIGFDTTTHKSVNVTYQNGKEVGRQESYVPFTMADLPYAKIYNVIKA